MPQRADRPFRMRGFTLVEMFAVLVILSVVVGLGAHGLSSSHSAAKFREASAMVRDLDRQARILARTKGPVRLTVNSSAQSLILHDSHTREIVFVASLPLGIMAGVETTDAAQAIVFDRSGRTVDYRITLKAEGRIEKHDISGLTGQVTLYMGTKP